MHAIIGQTFSVGHLTCNVASTSSSGAVIEFALVSSSGFTRTGVGHLTILYPCDGSRKVQMMLAIRADFQQFETVKQIQIAVFDALGIAQSETYAMTVCPPCVSEISTKTDFELTS